MSLVKNTNFEDFENSVVRTCFVPADFDEQSYYVKIQADALNLPAYWLGSVGDSHGTPELFRLLLPTPLAVGNRGKILSLSNNAIKHQYPSFVAIYQKMDGHNVIPAFYGTPSVSVDWLVATAWLPRPAGATEVEHIDGNPSNDAVENLKWVSHNEKLQRTCQRESPTWALDDYVLLVHKDRAPFLVHPSRITAITGFKIDSQILCYGTCGIIHEWYVFLNPNLEEALSFVSNLPFENISSYIEATENLFNRLGIG